MSAHEKAPVLRGNASSCDPLQNGAVEAAGIEPASRDLSTQASTCVAVTLTLPSGRFTADYRSGYWRTCLTAGVPHVTRGGPELATDFWDSPAKARSQWLL